MQACSTGNLRLPAGPPVPVWCWSCPLHSQSRSASPASGPSPRWCAWTRPHRSCCSQSGRSPASCLPPPPPWWPAVWRNLREGNKGEEGEICDPRGQTQRILAHGKSYARAKWLLIYSGEVFTAIRRWKAISLQSKIAFQSLWAGWNTAQSRLCKGTTSHFHIKEESYHGEVKGRGMYPRIIKKDQWVMLLHLASINSWHLARQHASPWQRRGARLLGGSQRHLRR